MTTELILKLEKLSLRIGKNHLLREIDVSIHRREIVVLRGENGAGKTTLLNILSGHLVADTGFLHLTTSGHRLIIDFSKRLLCRRIPKGFTPHNLSRLGLSRGWQDVRLFLNHTAAENIGLARPRLRGGKVLDELFFAGRSRREERVAAKEAQLELQHAGLGGRVNALAKNLSFGESKRVSLLRAVATGARLVLLDEPLSGLDLQGTVSMVALIKDLNSRDDPVSFLIVEHDTQLGPLLELCPRFLELRSGKISQNEPTKMIQNETGKGGSVFSTPSTIQGTVSPRKTCLPNDAILLQTGGDDGPAVLAVRQLRLIQGGRNLLQSDSGEGETFLDFVLRRGARAEIQAPNGWGKTTLLETLAGFHQADGGEALLYGKPLLGLASWERALAGLQYVPTKHNVFFSMSVAEMLHFTTAEDSELIALLDGLRDRRIAELSGGEQKRLALVCAVAQRPDLLLVDEPLSMLDAHGAEAFRSYVSRHESLTILSCIPRARDWELPQ